jgi:hypothetical protein
MPPFQLKNVQGANKRNSHEHGDTGSAAPNSCRPNKTAPAASESRSYGNPEIGRRSFGPHRRAEANSGADRENADRCQATRKAFLTACR